MNKTNRFLRIYLNDHLAGATVGVELAKRSQKSNKGTPLGDFLAEFAADVSADKAQLEELMAKIGAGRNMMKSRAAWVAEKMGRLKSNGQLTGYSDLGRLIELEGLMVGVTGKIGLWRSLSEAFPPPNHRLQTSRRYCNALRGSWRNFDTTTRVQRPRRSGAARRSDPARPRNRSPNALRSSKGSGGRKKGRGRPLDRPCRASPASPAVLHRDDGSPRARRTNKRRDFANRGAVPFLAAPGGLGSAGPRFGHAAPHLDASAKPPLERPSAGSFTGCQTTSADSETPTRVQ